MFLAFHDPEVAEGGVASSDIDLFLYNVSPQQATWKILHIYDTLKSHAAARRAEARSTLPEQRKPCAKK